MGEPEIAFRLSGHGWADLVIRSADGTNEISSISYLGNALDDLVRVGIGVATHQHFNTALFCHEPGSTVLVAETAWWEGSSWFDGARISAVRADDSEWEEPAKAELLKAPKLFSVSFSSPDAMAAAILRAAEQVETDHGIDGYNKLWNGTYGFPVRGVAALRAALAAPESERLDK